MASMFFVLALFVVLYIPPACQVIDIDAVCGHSFFRKVKAIFWGKDSRNTVLTVTLTYFGVVVPLAWKFIDDARRVARERIELVKALTAEIHAMTFVSSEDTDWAAIRANIEHGRHPYALPEPLDTPVYDRLLNDVSALDDGTFTVVHAFYRAKKLSSESMKAFQTDELCRGLPAWRRVNLLPYLADLERQTTALGYATMLLLEPSIPASGRKQALEHGRTLATRIVEPDELTATLVELTSAFNAVFKRPGGSGP
ncbi:MAG TPA: hypothetical protein VJR58_01690 [Vineibacter sp.]|nr:hypothetical protein [Vineibacter sp.]